MYYPILKARQFELISLRELATEQVTQRHITPVLEPVKETVNNLNLAFKILEKENQQAYLILNPQIGERKGNTDYYADYISDKSSVFKAAFHYTSDVDYIEKVITQYKLEDCMLLCSSENDLTDGAFAQVINNEKITRINIENPGRNRSLKNYIMNLGKDIIRRDDLFEPQARNGDFLKIQENRFSEEHIYYSQDNFNGFSDYTLMPSAFTDGGSTPRAVVIHLTYQKPPLNEFWIRHFTSKTGSDSIANVQGKFAEAAGKFVTFCGNDDLTNSAIAELKEYYDTQHYPGLGVVKKIALKNHLILVDHYLTNIPQ
jgi:hypothetical protein